MHYTIRQNGTTCQIVAADGTVVGTFEAAVGRTAYQVALAALGGIISAEAVAAAPLATTGEEGLLPEWWQSDEGIAFSVATPGGRDFSGCEWSWRDPLTSLLPVMFQTQNLPAHIEAQLAGFIVELSGGGVGPVSARGRFYDSEIGRAARDTLLGGRRFGVSVDPTENVTWDESFECIAWDDEGFCIDGTFAMTFHTYEIGGFTMEPHPCFETASIIAAEPPSAIAASAAASAQLLAVARGAIDATGPTGATGVTGATGATGPEGRLAIPTAPPLEWMRLPEPRPGVPFLDGLGDDVLVPQWADVTGQVQEIVGYAVPLTIRDDGLVYGHLTWWGQCHDGDPWGPGVCASAAPSRNGYRDFLTGTVVCEDGGIVNTGELVVGCEHSAAMDAAGVRDHLAHSGMGWASVAIRDGEYGPWLSGVLRPDLTPSQVRLLRALSLSGEWVGELAGILSVNTPGLPVQRLAASAAFVGSPIAHPDPSSFVIPAPALRASVRGGVVTKLIGGNIVRRCPECEQRRLARQLTHTDDVLAELRAMRQVVQHLEARTRHLVRAEAAALRDDLTGG